MNKEELKNKIKSIVKTKYSSDNTSDEVSATVDIDNPSVISLDNKRFPVLTKFPTLKAAIIKILTDQYDLFLKDIEWVAPRPTTFRIVLANDQVFYLIYTDRTWIGKVEGKKYYLLNMNEEQSCIEAIARILAYGTKTIPEKSSPKETQSPAPESAPEKEPEIEEVPPLKEKPL